MGRALERGSPRFIVKMKKITYPNSEKLTRSVVPFDADDVTYFPKGNTINEVLPKIDGGYHELIETFQRKGLETLPEALDRFFEKVSKFAIVGGLMDVLPGDLNLDIKVVADAFINTNWFHRVMDYVRTDFRKGKKVDAVRYAESVRELVEIFGTNYALALLWREDIKIKRSTIMALCRVGGETPRIKEVIRKGLKLTIAFELPSIDEEEREKIAEELVSKNYAEAKRYLKNVKMSLS